MVLLSPESGLDESEESFGDSLGLIGMNSASSNSCKYE
jgi:hypothetical protein